MIRWNDRPSIETRLTPRPVLDALGGASSFDLDPCAAPEPRPWPTALRMISLPDNGLIARWTGRVWLNPPYEGRQMRLWLARLAEHGRGVALVNSTTDTEAFQRHILEAAHGLFFIEGRLVFCDQTGEPIRARNGRVQNNPAPSVLAAYGQDDLDRLASLALRGSFVPLRFARFVLMDAMDPSWCDLVGPWLRAQRGPVNLADAYREFARHPKTRRNRHWQAKVRQTLQRVGERVAPATYQARLV